MRRSLIGIALLLLLLPLIAPAPAGAATRRAFLTSTTCSGDLGPCSAAIGDSGVAAANNICQERADDAGLGAGGAIFRAWLSDATADAYCNVLGLAGQRFGAPGCGVAVLPDAGPWTRLDGLPFAASLADLTGTGPITPMAVTETGAVLPEGNFLTGSLVDGTHLATHDCNGWTDGTAGAASAGGNNDVQGASWAAGATTSCVGPFRLVCFEVGAGDPLAYPSLAGALAFVTSTTHNGDLGGFSGADAICQSRAAAAALPFPSSFRAFLSTSTTDAEARLTIDGPWERVDGVPIADSKADLLDGTLDSAIAYNELDGRYQVDAWTGTQENGTASLVACNDWTTGSGANGSPGRPWRNAMSWTGTGAGAVNCSQPRHLFCFSNQLLLGWDSFESGNLGRWALEATGP